MLTLALILNLASASTPGSPSFDGVLELYNPKGRKLLDLKLSRTMCEAGANTPVFAAYEGATIQIEVTCPDNQETILRIQTWEPTDFMAWALWVQELRGEGDLNLSSDEWVAIPESVKAPSLKLRWH